MSGTVEKMTDTTIVDPVTGEILGKQTQTQTLGFVNSEPEYIKIYIGTQVTILDIDPSLTPVIVAFSKHMTYADDDMPQVVRTDLLTRDAVARDLKISTKRVDQLIKKLVDAKVFIPIKRETVKKIKDENGKTQQEITMERTLKGVYEVAPWVIGKGKWSNIKHLVQEINYMDKENVFTSITVNSETGVRKINYEKKKAKQIEGQLTLEDMGVEMHG